MAYSQLAPYGKGHLLPSAICKERRLAKWWAAQRAKNMPQTRLEKGENNRKHGNVWRNIMKQGQGKLGLSKMRWPFLSPWSQRVESLVASLTQVLKFDGHLKVAHPWKEPRLIHRIVEVYCWKKYGWGWDIVWLRCHEGTQIWFPWFCVGAGSCHLLSTYNYQSTCTHAFEQRGTSEACKFKRKNCKTASCSKHVATFSERMQDSDRQSAATCSCTWPLLLHDICSALRETELRQLL